MVVSRFMANDSLRVIITFPGFQLLLFCFIHHLASPIQNTTLILGCCSETGPFAAIYVLRLATC